MTEALTAVLVIVTIVYAFSTYRIQKANESLVALIQRQGEETLRPYVTSTIFLLPHNPIFYLRISNTGRSSAADLRLGIDRSFVQFGEAGPDRDIAAYRAFREPIDSLPPGGELVFPLAQDFVVFGEAADASRTPPTFTISATYSFAGKTYSELTRLDLRPYLMTSLPIDPRLSELEKLREAAEGIREAIRKLPNRQA